MAVKCVIYREVRRERDVDFLSVRRDPVQEQRVVHGAVPRHLEAIKRPARTSKNINQMTVILWCNRSPIVSMNSLLRLTI